MKILSTASKYAGRYLQALARARVQSTLLLMGRDWVEKYGYSWDLLQSGTEAWPWRKPDEPVRDEQEIRRAIHELHQLSDRELRELGLARSGIETAVRSGHPDRGFSLDDRDRAA